MLILKNEIHRYKVLTLKIYKDASASIEVRVRLSRGYLKFFTKNEQGTKNMSPDGGNPTREKRVATSGDIF